MPERVEVYDNSHLMGTHPMGAMVVYTADGWLRRAFRRFKIGRHGSGTAGNDDYAMLREVLTRRLRKLADEDDSDTESHTRPDLLLIDGGKGQFSAVREVLETLGLTDIAMVAIAKGPDREAGLEQFISRRAGRPSAWRRTTRPCCTCNACGTKPTVLPSAPTARPDRAPVRGSQLDSIPGIGPKRKKQLLLHFGSVRGVTRASVEELAKVGGINRAVAQKIYDALH